jgi:nitrite reductase/ring-hydroxylating ferredoxin subunit/uncharacterized membrane protein
MPVTRSLRIDLGTLSDHLSASMPWLDTAAAGLHATFDPILGERGLPALRDALYGTWLGHALHPFMTDLPIGFWTASMVLDATGHDDAADLMLKIGTVSALGAAVTGVAQWQDLQEMEVPRRIGALHALLNVSATTCYGLSWALRSSNERDAGKALSLLGGLFATAGGTLGGDLSFKLGIGVSRVAFQEPAAEWTTVATFDDLEEGTLTRVETDAEPLVLLRTGDEVVAASATCTHVGGPLDEGERDGTCVTCPWHGSQFDLRDGRVLHGPATSPLHTYETRIENGQVEVRALTPAN